MRFAEHFDVGVPVLALVGRHHFATQRVDHVLQAVTDAEHRNPEVKDAGIGDGRVVVVDRTGSAGKHDARGRIAADLLKTGGAGEDDGEDFLFADAARDELGILRAKVEDDDGLSFHG